MEENKIHAKLVLSLGDWSPEKMREIFTHKEIQNNFIKALIEIVKSPKYGIGGIDIDWEIFSPQKEEMKRLPSFLKTLQSALNNNKLNNTCVSLDLPISPAFAKAYPAPQKWIAYVDWANIVAYEYYGGNPPYTF